MINYAQWAIWLTLAPRVDFRFFSMVLKLKIGEGEEEKRDNNKKNSPNGISDLSMSTIFQTLAAELIRAFFRGTLTANFQQELCR